MASEPLLEQVKSEILASIKPVLDEQPDLKQVFDILVEPEYVHRWKAVWEDDQGVRHVNTCWRVQQNSALGPYKGGLRFDPSVTLDVLRFLALEQVFKNALTGKAIGGGKGGSDFNPKGKSDAEIRRFCEAFMLGLHKHIGPDFDVPAGDIGVGGKVIGYLYGMWRKLGHGHVGVLTGKGLDWGGSKIRTEATGYGLLYMVREVLMDMNDNVSPKKFLKSKKKSYKVLISGSGNVATYAAKKAVQAGGHVLTMSDRNGTYWCEKGLTEQTIDGILAFKAKEGGLPSGVEYLEGVKPWQAKADVQVDIALPCATQNEVDAKDAKALLGRGVTILAEGSNLSSTEEAVGVYNENRDKLDYVTSKLANLGGVGTSYLEMMQNSYKTYWTREKADEELDGIMKQAYAASKEAASKYNVSLTDGANISAFLKVAGVMKDLGYA